MLALWSLSLLTVFSVALGYGLRQKLSLVKRIDERERLRLIAEAGVRKALFELIRQETEGCNSLKDHVSNDPELFKDAHLEGGSFSVSYNFMNEPEGVLETRYGLSDEESKINLNTSGLVVLKNLFAAVGLDEVEAQELAASIVDWRDKDSQLSIPLGSAEDPYYHGLPYPYEAKDSEFESLDELLLVKGMTPEISEKLKDYVTVSSAGRININTASSLVLISLGLDEDTADKIIRHRSADDGVLGNEDDNVFMETSDIVPHLSQAFPLSDSQISKLTIVIDQGLDVYSNNFMIKSTAGLNNRKAELKVVCIADIFGKILYWREGI
ncbi:MAG: general secretion pathway protein GspK [Candidatus Omnitrophota bacterium]